MTSVARTLTQTKDEGIMLLTWVVFDGHENTLIWDSQAIPGDDIDEISETWRLGGYTAGSDARNSLDDPSIGKSLTLVYTTYELNELGLPVETGTTESTVNYAGRHQWVPGITSIEASSAIVIGESSYRELVGDQVVDSHTSSIWMFELCDENENGCSKALELLSADIKSNSGVISASDWSTAHEDNERNGGLIFGTPGLLSMMFVVAALASISSAFVFLSLVLSQRKRELAILQAIGASPNQVIRLVLFEIMSILLVSMVLGVTLGLAVSESFNGFFSVFGFIFQLFLGQSNPIDRDLVWPWFEIIAVNGLVLIAVIISLLFTTRRALDSDLATVLKGE
jgi:ABC-type antimicrobial peptide transport system permease subunit